LWGVSLMHHEPVYHHSRDGYRRRPGRL